MGRVPRLDDTDWLSRGCPVALEPCQLHHAAPERSRPLLQLPGSTITAQPDLEVLHFGVPKALRPEELPLYRAGVRPANARHAHGRFILHREAEPVIPPLLEDVPGQ